MSTSFSSRFKWEVLDSPTMEKNLLHFHSTKDGNASDSWFCVRFWDKNKSEWIGKFQSHPIYGSFSGVFYTPSSDHVCIISYGQSYFIDVGSPRDFFIPVKTSISNVENIFELSLILLVSQNEIYAFDSLEKRWETVGLASDGIKISEANPSFVAGEAWRPERGGYQKFLLSPDTGQFELLEE